MEREREGGRCLEIRRRNAVRGGREGGREGGGYLDETRTIAQPEAS